MVPLPLPNFSPFWLLPVLPSSLPGGPGATSFPPSSIQSLLGPESPLLGADARLPALPSLRPNHNGVTLPRGLISHQPFCFDVISPFSKPCSTPGLQILISLGGDQDAQPNLDQISLVPAARSRLPAHPRPGSAVGSSGKPVAGRDAAQRHRKKPRGTRGGQFRLCRESFRRDLCSASLSLLLPIPGRG